MPATSAKNALLGRSGPLRRLLGQHLAEAVCPFATSLHPAPSWRLDDLSTMPGEVSGLPPPAPVLSAGSRIADHSSPGHARKHDASASSSVCIHYETSQPGPPRAVWLHAPPPAGMSPAVTAFAPSAISVNATRGGPRSRRALGSAIDHLARHAAVDDQLGSPSRTPPPPTAGKPRPPQRPRAGRRGPRGAAHGRSP